MGFCKTLTSSFKTDFEGLLDLSVVAWPGKRLIPLSRLDNYIFIWSITMDLSVIRNQIKGRNINEGAL